MRAVWKLAERSRRVPLELVDGGLEGDLTEDLDADEVGTEG